MFLEWFAARFNYGQRTWWLHDGILYGVVSACNSCTISYTINDTTLRLHDLRLRAFQAVTPHRLLVGISQTCDIKMRMTSSSGCAVFQDDFENHPLSIRSGVQCPISLRNRSIGIIPYPNPWSNRRISTKLSSTPPTIKFLHFTVS